MVVDHDTHGTVRTRTRGTDDGILGDPHLGKAMDPVRRAGGTPLSSLSPVSSSAQPAESAHLQQLMSAFT